MLGEIQATEDQLSAQLPGADISCAGWPLKDRTSEDETGLEEKTEHTFNLGSIER